MHLGLDEHAWISDAPQGFGLGLGPTTYCEFGSDEKWRVEWFPWGSFANLATAGIVEILPGSHHSKSGPVGLVGWPANDDIAMGMPRFF